MCTIVHAEPTDLIQHALRVSVPTDTLAVCTVQRTNSLMELIPLGTIPVYVRAACMRALRACMRSHMHMHVPVCPFGLRQAVVDFPVIQFMHVCAQTGHAQVGTHMAVT